MRFFEEEDARALAYEAAFGFLDDTEFRDRMGLKIACWGIHGIDEQWFYTAVCIFYGADPNLREGFAEDLGLPENWPSIAQGNTISPPRVGVRDRTRSKAPGGAGLELLKVSPEDETTLLWQILRTEIDALNAIFDLPEPVGVRIEACGEANAFYDPYPVEIVFCREFVPHLAEMTRLFD